MFCFEFLRFLIYWSHSQLKWKLWKWLLHKNKIKKIIRLFERHASYIFWLVQKISFFSKIWRATLCNICIMTILNWKKIVTIRFDEVITEMEAFETNRRIFIAMGICKRKYSNRFFASVNLYFSAFMIFLASLGTVSSATFVYTNMKVDLEKALSAVFQVSGLMSSIYILTSGIFQRRRFAKIIRRTQHIYDESEFKQWGWCFWHLIDSIWNLCESKIRQTSSFFWIFGEGISTRWMDLKIFIQILIFGVHIESNRNSNN